MIAIVINAEALNQVIAEDDIRLPAEEFVYKISEKKDSIMIEVKSDESSQDGSLSVEQIITHLDFIKLRQTHPTTVGDTLTIFRDNAAMYRMTFIDFSSSQNSKSDVFYNVVASIFHNQGQRVWGNAIITKLDTQDNPIDCTPDDVLRIVYRRAWHKGFLMPSQDKVASGVKPKEVEIDNGWNIKGSDENISANNKKRTYDSKEKPCVRVDTSNGDYYLFSLLDEEGRVMIDMDVDTY